MGLGKFHPLRAGVGLQFELGNLHGEGLAAPGGGAGGGGSPISCETGYPSRFPHMASAFQVVSHSLKGGQAPKRHAQILMSEPERETEREITSQPEMKVGILVHFARRTTDRAWSSFVA